MAFFSSLSAIRPRDGSFTLLLRLDSSSSLTPFPPPLLSCEPLPFELSPATVAKYTDHWRKKTPVWGHRRKKHGLPVKKTPLNITVWKYPGYCRKKQQSRQFSWLTCCQFVSFIRTEKRQPVLVGEGPITSNYPHHFIIANTECAYLKHITHDIISLISPFTLSFLYLSVFVP